MTRPSRISTPTSTQLDTAAWITLFFFVASVQLSIAVSAILLTVVLLLCVAKTIVSGKLPAVPSFFWPLVAYSAWTMVSVVYSPKPEVSLVESKEVLLFLVVPVVFQLSRGSRATMLGTVLLTVGAITAVIGLVQYGILEYDNLGRRPLGSMGHYMTYSGLLMMVVCLAVSRILFSTPDRVWAALVLPVLCVVLALTLTRSAWIGACIGVSLLFFLKVKFLLVQNDFRWLNRAPAAGAIIFAVAAIAVSLAPAQLTDRVFATFDLQDPTNRDRLAMASVGAGMVRDHPVTGVGLEMIQERYSDYRPANAVNPTNPHLHNVPLQIAAERGLPGLAIWAWFIVMVTTNLIRQLNSQLTRALAAAGLAAIASMLGAGMFEYNFGDSEFLMMLLILVTLPAAAATTTTK